MTKHIKYKSVLAPYMDIMLNIRLSFGYSAKQIKYILKEFDDFAVGWNLQSPHIDEELIMVCSRYACRVTERLSVGITKLTTLSFTVNSAFGKSWRYLWDDTVVNVIYRGCREICRQVSLLTYTVKKK